MFRTRDFAVMLATIGFLVLAIVVTLSHPLQFDMSRSQGAAIFTTTDGEETYTATVIKDSEPPRDELIAALKKKIDKVDELAVAEIVPDMEPETSEVPVPTKTEEVKENRCTNHRTFAGLWSERGLIIEEVEGARLVYREVEAAVLDLASSSLPAAPAQRDVVLQLPVRSLPLSSQSCIGMDVIGIAKDGSLIRNNELSVYKIFGEETLIGYALDGFPIYGTSDAVTDICGGVMVAGQYRYHISTDRETILSCFAGAPAAL